MEILNGSNPELTDVVFAGNAVNADGGALRIDGASPVLRDVVFEGNTAQRNGGAVFVPVSELVVDHDQSWRRARDAACEASGAFDDHDRAVVAECLVERRREIAQLA